MSAGQDLSGNCMQGCVSGGLDCMGQLCYEHFLNQIVDWKYVFSDKEI